jgi:hypothetical protein
MGRVGLAFRCFFRVLSGKPVPEEALPEQEATPALPAPDEDVIGRERAVQMLGLLQKEGRLLDFLLEDIGATVTTRSAPQCARFTRNVAVHWRSIWRSSRCSQARRTAAS